MTQSNALHSLENQGWATGFSNLFRQESKKWWGTLLWLKHTILWILFINSLPLVIYLDRGSLTAAETLELFIFLSMFASVMGVIIVMQGVIVGEKQSGVTAWLVSKPVARPAYILSRLMATGLATLFTILMFPALASYGVMTQLGGFTIAIGSFAAAIGMIALFMLFLLTLTLMLGTVFNGRTFVIGVPMALVFMADVYHPLLARFAPGLLRYDPMFLLELAGEVALGKPLASPVTLISTAVWSLVFILVAIWQFNQEEF